MKNIKDICTKVICANVFSPEQRNRVVELLKEKTKQQYANENISDIDFEEIVEKTMNAQLEEYLSKIQYDESAIKFLIEDMKYINPKDYF